MREFIHFNYAVSGSHDKSTVLFLHGFMGEIDDWQAQNKDLSRDYHCLFLDLPGHGATEVSHLSGYDFVICAKNIVNFLKKNHFEPVNIVGYSLGGRLALYMSIYWPNLINRLILESASPGIAGDEDRLLRIHQDALLAEQIRSNWPGFIENWYRQPIFKDIFDSPGFAEMVKRKKLNDPEKLAYVLSGMGQGAQPSLWNHLKRINQPVLLLTGKLDSKYMVISQKMQNEIPNCLRYPVDDCSHNIHLQKPETFNSEVKNFLSNH